MRLAGRMIYLAVATVVALGACGMVLADQDRLVRSSDTLIVNLELRDTPVKQAIDNIFSGSGLKYYIQPGVSGKVVELKLKGVTVDQALGALTEAAGLTYKVEGGAYIISPAPKAQARRAPAPVAQESQPGIVPGAGPAAGSPQAQGQGVAPVAQPAPPPQVIINNQIPSPVYYGQPAAPSYGGFGNGYGGYPPLYQFGQVGVLGGWSPVVVAGGNPNLMQYQPRFPPPPGWVSPDVLRFLRNQYAVHNDFFFRNGY